ncbi:MAG: ABC transporter ATP-binding protein [Actinomadura sp.]
MIDLPARRAKLAMEVSDRMDTPAFALEHVTVRRGGAVLLDAVTCQIPSGACTALVGPSGSGKTTLLRLLNRLEEPTTGTVRFRGEPLPALDVLALRRRVGLVNQQPVLLTDAVIDDLRVGYPELAEQQATELLEQVHLPAALLHRATTGLSGGETQRVCLARTLAVAPEVLLLDEPTSALDPAGSAAVERITRELVAAGLTVVLVSHNAAQARHVSDQVLVLRGGRLVDQGHAGQIAYLKEGA